MLHGRNFARKNEGYEHFETTAGIPCKLCLPFSRGRITPPVQIIHTDTHTNIHTCNHSPDGVNRMLPLLKEDNFVFIVKVRDSGGWFLSGSVPDLESLWVIQNLSAMDSIIYKMWMVILNCIAKVLHSFTAAYRSSWALQMKDNIERLVVSSDNCVG